MTSNSLNGKWIVVTRPKHQAKSFIRNIEKGGGCLLHFPLIEITPFNDDNTHKTAKGLIDYDIVIFVSSNAVEQTIKLIGTKTLEQKILVTTGKKTAKALANHGLETDFCPDKFFNSEALLAIEAFKKASSGKKIAIVRGSSGRDYLKNNLISLGASVDYIDVYSRHCPQHNLDQLEAAYKQNKLDVVVLTSASSTASFFALVKNESWINEITILIGSSRMQHEIPAQFKGKILIAEDPSDETLLKTLTLELK